MFLKRDKNILSTLKTFLHLCFFFLILSKWTAKIGRLLTYLLTYFLSVIKLC